MLYRYDIDIATGDRLDGLSVGEERVNTHFSVVPRLRASGAVTALLYRGRPSPYFNHHNSTSVDVCRPVIDICGGVQFVMDINMGG
jgi:hypothetical protein